MLTLCQASSTSSYRVDRKTIYTVHSFHNIHIHYSLKFLVYFYISTNRHSNYGNYYEFLVLKFAVHTYCFVHSAFIGPGIPSVQYIIKQKSQTKRIIRIDMHCAFYMLYNKHVH